MTTMALKQAGSFLFGAVTAASGYGFFVQHKRAENQRQDQLAKELLEKSNDYCRAAAKERDRAEAKLLETVISLTKKR